MTCNCVADWRVELLDLATGVRRIFLQPLSFNFDTTLNEVGAASIVLPVRKLSMTDVWPRQRAVAITRVAGPNASTASPVAEYVGLIEDVRAESGGTLTLGAQSIDYYLNFRVIEDDTEYTALDQNVLGATLVNDAVINGVPLTGAAIPGSYPRDREYLASDDKFRLEAIQQLTQVENGPDYTVSYTFANGAWSAVMTFQDYAGNTTAVPLNVRRGLTSYSLNVNGSDHRNWERGRGNDIEYTADTLPGSAYPRFDAAVQWSDVSEDETLQEHVRGDLINESDPTALPEITIADLDLAAAFNLGDHVNLNMSHGAIQFQGEARLIRKSWSVGAEQPSMCTFGLVPITPPEQSVLAVPFSASPGCC